MIKIATLLVVLLVPRLVLEFNVHNIQRKEAGMVALMEPPLTVAVRHNKEFDASPFFKGKTVAYLEAISKHKLHIPANAKVMVDKYPYNAGWKEVDRTYVADCGDVIEFV